ncbi:MAG: efflux RND transporter periplasmic adaptor subunit [Victivallaceae bacterium]|nr:HlyD family efflux transporter periplasmic adaptor subunit [Victivallaceae bacterium]
MKKRNKVALWLLALLLLLGGAGFAGWWFWLRTPADSANVEDNPDRLYKVRRGDMPLGVIVSGNVNARQKLKLTLEANVQTKVLTILAENTKVKEGDVIIKFDAENLTNSIADKTVELDNLEKELDVMKQQLEIQNSTDLETMRAATDRLIAAEDALRKYRRYELRQSRDSYDAKIATAETALETARTAYSSYLDEIATSASSDSSETEAREQKKSTLSKAITSAEKEVEAAESSRKVFLRYDNPSKLKGLVNAVEQARLNLRKEEVSINATHVQKQRQIDNMITQIRRRRTDLELQKSYVPMMELKAPVDGVVLYGDPDERWNRTEIQAGMDAFRGRVLVTIPDMRNLIVDFPLPETFRSRVNKDDKVIITPDSLEGVKISGKITDIATVPVNEPWYDTSAPKVFPSKVELDPTDAPLVNGMSVKIEIVTGIVRNALFVPQEAVNERGDQFFVYRQTITGPKEAIVTIGKSNDTNVEITSGLNEGDVVYLYKPFQSGAKPK